MKCPEKRPSARGLLSHPWLSAYITLAPFDPPPHPSNPVPQPLNPTTSIAALQHCAAEPVISSCQSVSFNKNHCSSWQSPAGACLSPDDKYASQSGPQYMPSNQLPSAAAATDTAAESRFVDGPETSNTAAKHAHKALTASGAGDCQCASNWERCMCLLKEELTADSHETAGGMEEGKLEAEAVIAPKYSYQLPSSWGHDSSQCIEACFDGLQKNLTGQVCSRAA